ncbi:MAG: hypothetical protein Kow0042_15360 [Calditrichia bacterium]
MLYRFLFFNAIKGNKSLLQVDQWGRLHTVKALFQVGAFRNFRYRSTVFSDTRIAERFEVLETDALRRLNVKVARALLEAGLLKAVGVLDGPMLGHRHCCVFGLVTRWGDVMLLDVEPTDSSGDEFNGSDRVMKRGVKLGFAGLVDYCLFDALYVNERVLGWHQKGWVKHLVIKYSPKDSEAKKRFRRMITVFDEMVDVWQIHPSGSKAVQLQVQMGFQEVSGRDRARKQSYRIFYASSNRYDRRWAIARVEEWSADEQVNLFYVFTTDKALPPESLWEMAHQRWCIENDGFKLLNAQVGSKKHRLSNLNVWLNWLLIQILAVGLLMLFRREYVYQWRRAYGGVKLTLGFVGKSLLEGNLYIEVHWLDS